jgi:hypothetical protein
MLDQNDEQKFKEHCEAFLVQIERLDAEIEAAVSDKKRVKKLQREKDTLQRQFATHLGDSTVSRVYNSRGHQVAAYWRVGGWIQKPPTPTLGDRSAGSSTPCLRELHRMNGAKSQERGEILRHGRAAAELCQPYRSCSIYCGSSSAVFGWQSAG